MTEEKGTQKQEVSDDNLIDEIALGFCNQALGLAVAESYSDEQYLGYVFTLREIISYATENNLEITAFHESCESRKYHYWEDSRKLPIFIYSFKFVGQTGEVYRKMLLSTSEIQVQTILRTLEEASFVLEKSQHEGPNGAIFKKKLATPTEA